MDLASSFKAIEYTATVMFNLIAQYPLLFDAGDGQPLHATLVTVTFFQSRRVRTNVFAGKKALPSPRRMPVPPRKRGGGGGGGGGVSAGAGASAGPSSSVALVRPSPRKLPPPPATALPTPPRKPKPAAPPQRPIPGRPGLTCGSSRGAGVGRGGAPPRIPRNPGNKPLPVGKPRYP
jgi:hypothetical protein